MKRVNLVRRNKWIGIVRRGGCSFARKIQLATRLGAKSLIILDNVDSPSPVMMNTIGKLKLKCPASAADDPLDVLGPSKSDAVVKGTLRFCESRKIEKLKKSKKKLKN